MITNLVCRRLDRRLRGLCEALGFVYTRYADDMSFSSQEDTQLGVLLRRACEIVAEEGFELRPSKTRVLRGGGRQEVTGLVVNERLRVPREQLRRFRALLFHIERDGPAGKFWRRDRAGEEDILAVIEGFASYVSMVDPEGGRALRARVDAILETWRGAVTA